MRYYLNVSYLRQCGSDLLYLTNFLRTVTLLGATPTNPKANSFKASIRRYRSNAYEFKRRPKDLKYFSKNYEAICMFYYYRSQDLLADKVKPFNSVVCRFYNVLTILPRLYFFDTELDFVI